MARILALLLIFCTACSSSHKDSLAICAIFKNEARWLNEWLTYHRDVLGVDHFYLYNNESSDDFRTVLQPFIEAGIVDRQADLPTLSSLRISSLIP